MKWQFNEVTKINLDHCYWFCYDGFLFMIFLFMIFLLNDVPDISNKRLNRTNFVLTTSVSCLMSIISSETCI